ncbi:MAG: formate dehydrogenase subunit gamma, partial [Rhizobiaceae bacterium]
MMHLSWPLSRPLIVLSIAFMLVMSGAVGHRGSFVLAQTGDTGKPTAGSTPGGVNSGSASDAELWRQIRKGQPGTVSGGNPGSGMMIQSAGQDWRLIRNNQLPKYSAWAILGMLLLLSLFFALRGRIKIDHGPSGQTIRRFSLIERVGHWLLASSFILLALTGLNLVFGRSLLIPLLGKDTFASITVFGKFIHNYVAFAFILGLIMIVVMWIRHNIPSWVDVKWLVRGGGLLGGGHPPAKKFNAGQKIIFWIVVLCGISISISGWALMNPFTTNMFSGTFALTNSWFGTTWPADLSPVQEQQYQSIWHAIMAVFMVVVIFAHIYIGSVGMEGALPAMTTGEVDTNWAREHHSLWVEKMEPGGSETSTPAGAPSDAMSAAGSPTAVITADSTEKSAATSAPTMLPAVPRPPLPVSKSPLSTKTVAPASPAKPAVPSAKPAEPQAKAKTKTARKLTGKTASKAATKPKARGKDDLKRIKGIGSQNEKRLNSIGVTRFEDIAKWTKKQQADIGERLA